MWVSVVIAICLRCGGKKKRPSQQCGNCHFRPTNDEERAKSIILSTAYEIDGEYKGKTQTELNEIRERIRAGIPYVFDQKEVDSVIAYALSIQAIPRRRLILDGLKWLAPPLVVLAIVYFLIFRK